MPDTFSTAQSPIRQPYNPLEGKGFRDVRLPSIRQILSPPVSPATNLDQEPGIHGGHIGVDVMDPELFPRRLSTVQPLEASQPLFRAAEIDDTTTETQTVARHIQAREARGNKQPTPTYSEYILAATFRQKVVDRFNENPQLYIQKELEYLQAYPSRQSLPLSKRKVDTEKRSVKRLKSASKPMAERTIVPKRAPRSSPRDAMLDSFDVEPAPKHRRKPSHTVPALREDMDFRKVPDLAPPIFTIPPGKNLKVDWKGHPLDLRDDVDRHLLDEQEINLASVLRLTGCQYLFAKRKIFERYVELARIGKDFNKTSAQAVCHIDVNKASKLWTAFEKVGWFDRKHFLQYL